MYKFRLFGASGKVVAFQQIFAFDDDEALSIAHAMVKGAPAKFDVWDGERQVGGFAPKEALRRGIRGRRNDARSPDLVI